MTDLVSVVSSPWFWTFYGLLGTFIHAKLRDKEDYDLFIFKDFAVFWASLGFLVLGFSLQYNLTNEAIMSLVDYSSWGQALYMVLFMAVAVLMFRGLLKTNSKYWGPIFQLVVAFSLGAILRTLYEGGLV